MIAENLKEKVFYWYKAPYGKDRQIYKCTKCYFNESQDQWKAKFTVMTDTSHSNSVGRTESLNEIEITRYIFPIENVEGAFSSFERHQKSTNETEY